MLATQFLYFDILLIDHAYANYFLRESSFYIVYFFYTICIVIA